MAFEPAERKKKTVRGRRKWGRQIGRGHVFGGGGTVKGKREGVRRSLGETEGGDGDVRHRVCKKRRRRRGRSRKRTDRRERKKRSRALSCRPGSQIRRGLKSRVDCV